MSYPVLHLNRAVLTSAGPRFSFTRWIPSNAEKAFPMSFLRSIIPTTVSAETSPLVQTSVLLCSRRPYNQRLHRPPGSTHIQVIYLPHPGMELPEVAVPRQGLTQRLIQAFMSLLGQRIYRQSISWSKLCCQTYMDSLLAIPDASFSPCSEERSSVSRRQADRGESFLPQP
ncbi:hypothetical protein J6590_089023 [Homalodisca vitripennis]|nr:hypothetical protein J6590_089023 [Homalodisca vitripennis]